MEKTGLEKQKLYRIKCEIEELKLEIKRTETLYLRQKSKLIELHRIQNEIEQILQKNKDSNNG